MVIILLSSVVLVAGVCALTCTVCTGRSVIHKVCEGDECASRPMVLCVSSVLTRQVGKSHSEQMNTEEASFNGIHVQSSKWMEILRMSKFFSCTVTFPGC